MVSTGHWEPYADNEKAVWVPSLHADVKDKAVDVMTPQNSECQVEIIASMEPLLPCSKQSSMLPCVCHT